MSEPSTTDQMTAFVVDLFRDANPARRRMILDRANHLADEWHKVSLMTETFDKRRVKYARKTCERWRSLIVGLASLPEARP